MTRGLFRMLAGLSLLLCLGVAIVCVRSFWNHDWGRFSVRHTHDRIISVFEMRIVSERGRANFSVSNLNIMLPRVVDPKILAPAPAFLSAGSIGIPYLGRPNSFQRTLGFYFLHDKTMDRLPVVGNPTVFHQELGPTVLLGLKFVAATNESWTIGIPTPLIVLVCGLLPIIWLLKSRRRHERLRHGLCAECGYDLRATLARCPECGMIAVAKSKSCQVLPATVH
jgi:hypothetical protein